MAVRTLAIKYRPTNWDDVTEQESIKIILQQQLETGEIKNAYLFCGPAGCGKTTAARIFANEINKGHGTPIEMDAASNSGVEDVRNITSQAKMKSMDSEYKVFIIDECHSISPTGWQAFLKLIEEPPAKSIFIFCTTDPQKIPKTILSRVQRYDFKRISQQGIVERLWYVLEHENYTTDKNVREAVEYIAKLAEGGMRDALSLMDKCLSFDNNLTLENVVKALGTVDYTVMMNLTNYIIKGETQQALQCIDDMYAEGKDIKQFVNQYVKFLLDIQKYAIGCDFKYMQLPALEQNMEWLDNMTDNDLDKLYGVLKDVIKLNSDIKWSQTPKYDLQAVVLLACREG